MSLFNTQFWRALADYRIKFPNKAALGEAGATWLTEYARVKATAFASVLITSSTTEGGSGSGARNFSQETLVDALHCRRAELDDEYELPEYLAAFEAQKLYVASQAGRGRVLQFSC